MLSVQLYDFVRVLQDVVQLLVDKGVILFTDLPESAQEKMLYRQRLRSKMGGNLNLIGDDQAVLIHLFAAATRVNWLYLANSNSSVMISG